MSFPETITYQTVLHERNKSAIAILEEFCCFNVMQADEQKRPYFKLQHTYTHSAVHSFQRDTYKLPQDGPKMQL